MCSNSRHYELQSLTRVAVSGVLGTAWEEGNECTKSLSLSHW